MDLNIFWFILIMALFAGFFLLEGFDFGVGMLLPFLGKNDTERRVILNTVGPFWDGNEVWLVTAVGGMLAAFPHWYATVFSGFYLLAFLMLLALILRGVAFEFRSKDKHPTWRRTWDWICCISSAMPGFLWGVIIANCMVGIPIDASMNYVGNFWHLFNPFALLCGLVVTSFCVLHGVTFLTIRTEGSLLERAKKAILWTWLPALLLSMTAAVSGYFFTDIFARSWLVPQMAVVEAGLALVLVGWCARTHHYGTAFIMSSLTMVLSALTIALAMFPNVVISSLDPAWNLTIYNSSASPYSLTVVSWIALSLLPLVLAYQGWNYWIFRQRVSHRTMGHY